MSNWLVDKLIPSIVRSEAQKSSVPEGLWRKCPSCEAVLIALSWKRTWMSAPSAVITYASTPVVAWISFWMKANAAKLELS